MNSSAPPVGAFSNLTMNAPYTYYPPQIQVRPPIKATAPFLAAAHRPTEYDGRFRVVLVSSDSPASATMPSLVGSLCRDPAFDIQVVATLPSLRYYDQQALDEAVKRAWNIVDDGTFEWGVRRWTDTDETEAWSQPGDPVLPSELARWADLVVVAPCSADMLAKIVAGFADNLALSVLRSVSSSTPVLLCPAMTLEMHTNSFTQKHTITARASGFIVLGPQGAGKNSERSGEMTDWRDIVNAIQDMAALHQMRQAQAAAERNGDPSSGPAVSGYQPMYMREAVPPMPIRDPMTLLEATAKAGSTAQAFIEAEAAGRKRDDDVVMTDKEHGVPWGPNEEKNGISQPKDKSENKGEDNGKGEKVELTGFFKAFRPGWQESVPIGPDNFLVPIPGLPTTEPGRINLGPCADSLTKTPLQFSSAGHWKLMSETGYFRKKCFIHASTMMAPKAPSLFGRNGDDAVGMYVTKSAMERLDVAD